jgi:hypothetical protein
MSSRRPLAIDLCCGKGGWTKGLQKAGFQVIGFDIERFPDYPGELVLQDIRTLHGSQFRDARVILASPPCQEFSRHDIPQTRKLNPPPPDLSLVLAVWRLREESGVPTILENTRGSLPFLEPLLGQARRVGSFWLYGDLPVLLPKMWALGSKAKKKRIAAGKPLILPGEYRGKELMCHNAASRAVIPEDLANWIGSVYAQ